MAKYWSQQVRPRSPEVALITLDATTKLPVGKKADQLREDGAALIHEPLSALLAFKSRQARNDFNLLRSYYLQPAHCNLTGQQCTQNVSSASFRKRGLARSKPCPTPLAHFLCSQRG